MSNVKEFPTWRTALKRSDKGEVLPTSGNCIIMLDSDPSMAGMLGYDDLADRAVLTRAPPTTLQAERPGPYPRTWQTADVELILAYIQHDCSKMPRETVRAAMSVVASAHRFHPIRDWLDSIRWDGRERVTKWLQATFDAPDTALNRAIGRAFLVAAVRRVRQPGCKFDYMLVLEGQQGLGKSTSLRALFGEDWFTDRLPRDLDSPDAIRSMLGKWCVEVAENDQIIRGGVETIKAFLSRSVDRIVPKYENEARDIPRQCVVVGTTNRDDYLRDSTGNRRFWPVECRAAAPAWLAFNRDQLWAEACAIEASGADVWLTDPDLQADAATIQRERVSEDVWEDRIARFAENRFDVSVADVMSDCLGIPTDRQDMRLSFRVGECLRKLGYEKAVVRHNGRLAKRWRMPVTSPSTGNDRGNAEW